jgi:hypothetical protein
VLICEQCLRRTLHRDKGHVLGGAQTNKYSQDLIPLSISPLKYWTCLLSNFTVRCFWRGGLSYDLSVTACIQHSSCQIQVARDSQCLFSASFEEQSKQQTTRKAKALRTLNQNLHQHRINMFPRTQQRTPFWVPRPLGGNRIRKRSKPRINGGANTI